jgi:hypothetical protein
LKLERRFMADDPSKSRLSGAGAYIPFDPKKHALETLETFNRVTGREHTPDRQTAQLQAPRRESDMVRKDNPFPEPTPEGDIRRDVIEIDYNRRLDAERDAAQKDIEKALSPKEADALKALDAFNSRLEQQKNVDLSHDRDNDHDQGR